MNNERDNSNSVPAQEPANDFISTYLANVGESEVPMFFHRWSAIVGLGAWLGRDVWFNFGNHKIFPNMYAMLLADPGVKKSSAIKLFKKLLSRAGYNTFAAEKSSKEKFLMDLAELNSAEQNPQDFLDRSLWGDSAMELTDTSEVFIVADEFNDFFGNNIMEFVSLLGVLWDYDGVYENRIKNSQSIKIPNPTVSILSGNTPTTFFNTFGQEVMGQGFFSRLLFIHSDSTGRKIAFPQGVSDQTMGRLAEELIKIKGVATGEIKIGKESLRLIEKIYVNFDGLADTRFAYYANRRQTHFLKLCMILAIADCSNEVLPIHVIRANTVLTHTEFFMPRALGEFGKAKNSDIVHKILNILEGATEAMTMTELWQQLYSDLNNLNELADILKNLAMADRLQQTDQGLLPKRKIKKEMDSSLFDWEYLTDEERGK